MWMFHKGIWKDVWVVSVDRLSDVVNAPCLVVNPECFNVVWYDPSRKVGERWRTDRLGSFEPPRENH